MYTHRLYRWEAALLMAFAILLTIGMWASVTQSALADEVLRLHVVANSDSDADQAVKLQVRDAILSAATPYLDGVQGQQQAQQALEPHLNELAQAGAQVLREAGMDYPITVSIQDVWFPTREYTDFALPAGTYRSLQVILGDGRPPPPGSSVRTRSPSSPAKTGNTSCASRCWNGGTV